jgi:hypothetical protein
MKILFLYGWQSVPGGFKPTFLAQHGHEIINPKLSDDDFQQAVKIAQEEFDQHQPDVAVGSSRGGAVAMNIDSGSARATLSGMEEMGDGKHGHESLWSGFHLGHGRYCRKLQNEAKRITFLAR